jgi:hypothetical protein
MTGTLTQTVADVAIGRLKLNEKPVPTAPSEAKLVDPFNYVVSMPSVHPPNIRPR